MKYPTCNWPRDTDCGDRPIKPITNMDTKCPPVGNSIDHYLDDESDCNSYYLCQNGKAQHFRCPYGLKWDSENKKCEWPELSTCSNQ